MFYHRGKELRPQFKPFELGIQKSEEAINNIVGELLERKTKNSAEVVALAGDAVRYLKVRSNFWRQQEPMYVRMQRTTDINPLKLKRACERRGMQAIQQIVQTLEDVTES
ncbi:unnamed protein product [Dibothriocephalus latus]|uniref:Uncharacterized protein n=1 Tax=Dibothriocephalus latus TaxID=60516 RepID=A0A3P7P092_DIBLA|nr:unnamed protein product [Dibothriocephalus latus]